MGSRNRLNTWAGRSSFEYEGSLAGDVTLHYGKNYSQPLTISGKEVLRGIRQRFSGREVPIGTHRTDPPLGSFGEWLLSDICATAIASYVGPILLKEGLADRGSASSRIRFR